MQTTICLSCWNTQCRENVLFQHSHLPPLVSLHHQTLPANFLCVTLSIWLVSTLLHEQPHNTYFTKSSCFCGQNPLKSHWHLSKHCTDKIFSHYLKVFEAIFNCMSQENCLDINPYKHVCSVNTQNSRAHTRESHSIKTHINNSAMLNHTTHIVFSEVKFTIRSVWPFSNYGYFQ